MAQGSHSKVTKNLHDAGCHCCALSAQCIPAAFDEQTIKELESIITTGEKYPAKQIAYREGDTLQSLYVVKSGAVKTHLTDAAGNERITGFYLPGEMVGLESVAGRKHLNTAITMTDSRLCKISYAHLANLRKNNPHLSDWAINLFSNSLASDHNFFQCLSLHTANAKLATFLLDIAQRSSHTDQYQLDFTLPMSRQDIGNYLGLATETTSRAFSRLVESRCIKKQSKQITIIDLTKLQAQANICSSQ